MKFARELEENGIPEWRTKYLNYKQGKKKIKAISRALREANRTPLQPSATPTNSLPFTHYDHRARKSQKDPNKVTYADSAGQDPSQIPRHDSTTLFTQSPPVLIPGSQPGSEAQSPEGSPQEDTPLQRSRVQRYGSIIGSPPNAPAHLPTLDLPDPALNPQKPQPTDAQPRVRLPSAIKTDDAALNAYRIGKDSQKGSLAKRMFQSRHRASAPSPGQPRSASHSKLRRIFTSHHEQTPTGGDVQLEAYEKLDARQDEFFSFLDKELAKVEEFYKFKEDEANERLRILRQQLHQLRDQRLMEIRSLHMSHNGEMTDVKAHKASLTNGFGVASGLKPIGELVSGKAKIGRVSKSLQQHASPELSPGQAPTAPPVDNRADYVRRQHYAPSYRVAKRRLKLAMQEYYRGLELLKSYSLLNQTAFRKINKKYDKAINARPPLRYYSEYVQNAYFVKTDVISNHMVAVEDLYSRYFEKGNHKIAVSKLRSKLKDGDYSAVTFRNGFWVAAGACLGIAGLVEGLRLLFTSEGAMKMNTSYLLQLHGGYFLALLLGLAFILNCRTWKANRINYAFVFEFDSRHTLDWRQLAELPCFFLFLNGLFVYINFREPHTDTFFLYWPVVLIGLTLIIMALPFKILYPHARKWWGYSNWRLLCAGLYPVEFRDFYLGDMYTSSSYTMSQVALFFCLYSSEWNNPPHCNSNHSRLLGFFTAFPAILRALQCLRRYWDSRNWFPHLANFAKYCSNILYYTCLSLYRIDMSYRTRAAFIAFAAANSIYCTFWDIFMDWSLGDWVSSNKLLRARLAYKRRRIYYLAILMDVILRQQWIVYAIFTEDLQHSSAASFFVGLAEVFRRGMWSLFRVENEHCNNVDKFRASRDVPLPYKLRDDESVPSSQHRLSTEQQRPEMAVISTPSITTATGADLERQRTDDTAAAESIRRRKGRQTPTLRALARVATIIAGAHNQDYEKKKRPVGETPEDEPLDPDESSDEEEEAEGVDAEDGGFRASVDVQDRENVDEARRLVDQAARTG